MCSMEADTNTVISYFTPQEFLLVNLHGSLQLSYEWRASIASKRLTCIYEPYPSELTDVVEVLLYNFSPP